MLKMKDGTAEFSHKHHKLVRGFYHATKFAQPPVFAQRGQFFAKACFQFLNDFVGTQKRGLRFSDGFKPLQRFTDFAFATGAQRQAFPFFLSQADAGKGLLESMDILALGKNWRNIVNYQRRLNGLSPFTPFELDKISVKPDGNPRNAESVSDNRAVQPLGNQKFRSLDFRKNFFN